MAYKILAEQESLSNTFSESISNATTVRLYNDTGGDVLVGRYDYANSLIGSITVRTLTEMVLVKEATDFLMVITGSSIKATKVGAGF